MGEPQEAQRVHVLICYNLDTHCPSALSSVGVFLTVTFSNLTNGHFGPVGIFLVTATGTYSGYLSRKGLDLKVMVALRIIFLG